MAAPCIALTDVLALVRRMQERALADNLSPDHQMRVRARELDDAARQRFDIRPPDISVPGFIDAFKRAYAAWHNYTGEET